MGLNELEERKKKLEEELKEIEIEKKQAEEQLQKQKTAPKIKSPPNVVKISKITVKRLIREIQALHDEKFNEIELWARGRMIQTAFFIACCDTIKKLYTYKETRPSLDHVENREKKGEMFDIATVKIILTRLEG